MLQNGLASLRCTALVARSRGLGQRCHSMPPRPEGESNTFEIVEETVVWQRYLTLYDRKVKFPLDSRQQGAVLAYDIIGHPQNAFHFAVCFPFHPPSDQTPASVTIIREYCQGTNMQMYNLPCGGFDPRKHTSYEACAAAELSEETGLTGGVMHKLIPEGHPGMCEVKWCANRFTPLLCVGPIADPNPGRQDAEEHIEVKRVTIGELRAIMLSGDMLLPAITTSYLALQRLQDLGFEVNQGHTANAAHQ